VGFVRDLPHRLVASFRATLEETIHADLLLHMVDAASPFAVHQYDSANAVIAELGCGDYPTITLLNKMDIAQDLSMAKIIEHRAPQTLRLSARTGEGSTELAELVRTAMKGGVVEATLSVPGGTGKVIAEIERRALVLRRRYVDSIVEFDVKISETQLSQLSGRYPELKLLNP